MNKLRKLVLEALNPPKKVGCSCGCNTCNTAPLINESKKYDYAISVNMRYHIDTKTPIHDSILPSTDYKALVTEAKILYRKGIIKLQGEDLNLLGENEGEKWQVIFWDINYEETPVKQLFNSEKEANDWAYSNEWDEDYYDYDEDMNDRLFTRQMYFNPEDKENYVSLFEESDLQKLFKGDFSDIRKVLTSNPDAKVGFLLGARSSEAGKVYQDMYKEMPMRSYQVNNANNDYLIKRVTESQQNAKYANTIFDLNDLSYKKYDANAVSTPKADSVDDSDNDLPF